jgi:Outer membrane protein beta-barrel domain
MRVATLAVLVTSLTYGTPRPANAQISLGPISGALTGHIGTASGENGAGTTLSLGGSMAVVEQSGWGAELDAGYANDDGGRTGGLNVQTYILNLIGVWPKGQLRPFGTIGGGALWARTCTEACAGTISWSDWAFSAGGGLQYVHNEVFGVRGDVRYFTNIGNPSRAADGVGFWRVSVGATLLWVAD